VVPNRISDCRTCRLPQKKWSSCGYEPQVSCVNLCFDLAAGSRCRDGMEYLAGAPRLLLNLYSLYSKSTDLRCQQGTQFERFKKCDVSSISSFSFANGMLSGPCSTDKTAFDGLNFCTFSGRSDASRQAIRQWVAGKRTCTLRCKSNWHKLQLSIRSLSI